MNVLNAARIRSTLLAGMGGHSLDVYGIRRTVLLLLLAATLAGCVQLLGIEDFTTEDASADAASSTMLADSATNPSCELRFTYLNSGDMSLRDPTRGTTLELSKHAYFNERAERWSPNQRQILFLSTRGGRGNSDDIENIWVVNSDGMFAKNLTIGSTAHSWSPAWSPDGETIAYISASHLWTMSADGSDKTMLDTGNVITAGAQPLFWSPDGTQLAFSGLDNPTSTNADAYLHTLKSAQTRNLTTNSPGSERLGGWAPDGSRLVFDKSGSQEIWTVTTNGMLASATPSPKTYNRLPRWSPDGQYIYFTGFEPTIGKEQVYRVASAGGVSEQVTTYRPSGWGLTAGGNGDALSDVSPDGHWVLFLRDDATVGVAAADRSEERLIKGYGPGYFGLVCP